MSMIGRDRRAILGIVGIFGMALVAGISRGAVKADDEPRRLPQEAIDACRDKGQGDTCTVSFGGRDVPGKCRAVGGDQIVCVPDQAPPPPPEALDACRDKGRGDACTLSFRGHEIQGTCFEGAESLFCRPSGPPSGK